MAPASEPGLSSDLRRLLDTLSGEPDMGETIRLATGEARPLPASLPRLDVTSERSADLQVLRELGIGGMGEVRLARQTALSREVALKTVNPRVRSTSFVEGALLREGVVTGGLEHPNIVPVHMMGVDGQDRPVIVMKRVEGVPWSELDAASVAEQTTLWSGVPLLRHLEIFLEVCSAVAFAHARGLVHRDIKPSNVMIGAFGEVYLLDWGLACPVGTGAFDHGQGDEPSMPLGTPLYMAPEMVSSNGTIDEQTDVYLLGATLHRMLTGKPRHRGPDLVTVMSQVVLSEPYPYEGEVPAELATICNRATARRKATRYPSAALFREAVMAYLRHRSSFELAREGQQRLDQVAGLVARGDEASQTELRRLFTESRFAFMRALREWDGNARARQGLQDCLETMIGVEIDRGQLDSAQALLDELPEPNAELQRRLDDRRERDDIERQQVASLREMAFQMDAQVSRWPRAILVVVIALLVVGTATTMHSESAAIPKDATTGLIVMAPFVLAYLVAVTIFRRRLIRNAASRRLVALVGIAIGAMTLNRALGTYIDISMEPMLSADFLLLGAITATGGVTVDRVLWWPAAVWLAGAAAMLMLPNPFPWPYVTSQIGGLLLLAYLWMGRPKDKGSRA
ncbi:MAG: serine/threonine protein kinase [Deltaproteobacteria bacterium]|nr:serine/threonine protein kinase [Deltaproteobacteria bacterium]